MRYTNGHIPRNSTMKRYGAMFEMLKESNQIAGMNVEDFIAADVYAELVATAPLIAAIETEFGQGKQWPDVPKLVGEDEVAALVNEHIERLRPMVHAIIEETLWPREDSPELEKAEFVESFARALRSGKITGALEEVLKSLPGSPQVHVIRGDGLAAGLRDLMDELGQSNGPSSPFKASGNIQQ